MTFLVLAILSSTGVSLALRLSNNHEHYLYGKFFCNYVVCALCALVSMPVFSWHTTTSLFSLLNGFLLIIGLFLMQFCMRVSGIALTSLYGRLGVCVPLILSIFLFQEMPTVIQSFGVCLSIGSIILFFYQSKISFQLGLSLILYTVMSGLGDTMSKIYQFYGCQDLSGQYLFLSFIIAALLSLILMLVKKQKITTLEMFYGLLIGIPNYFSSRFLLLSLNEIPSIIVYPTYAMTTILMISLCGYLFFKEKIDKEVVLTYVLIIISIGLLNI